MFICNPAGDQQIRCRGEPSIASMYSTCIHCTASLEHNRELEHLPVGRRVAFDADRGRLWVVCLTCARWNLAPLEERWEAVDECERRFRRTHLRYSTAHVGLARLSGGTELVRIGRPLRPELAAWRYGRVLHAHGTLPARAAELALSAIRVAAQALGRRSPRWSVQPLRLVMRYRAGDTIDLLRLPSDECSNDVLRSAVRYRHLPGVSLARPSSGQPWTVTVPHDHGTATLVGSEGLRALARLLAAVNRAEAGAAASEAHVSLAVRKLDESAHDDSYFNRVLALALRSQWGIRPVSTAIARSEIWDRCDSGASPLDDLELASTDAERFAFRLTGRSFWGRGGTNSALLTPLVDLTLVDRLALEMAANEDVERRAMEGELAELEEAWREAEEIAAIADGLLPISSESRLPTTAARATGVARPCYG